MTDQNDARVEVIQSDREAAADYFALILDSMPNVHARASASPSALARAFARHRIASAATARGEAVEEIAWEVWQDDMLVASSTSEADARHYLAVYSQDGPARLVKAVTHRTDLTPPARDEGGL